MIISDGVTGAEGGLVGSVDMAVDSNGDVHFVWSSTTDRVDDGFDSTDKDLYHRILRKNADRPEVNTADIPLVRTIPSVETGASEQKADENPALVVDLSNNVHLVWQRDLVDFLQRWNITATNTFPILVLIRDVSSAISVKVSEFSNVI